ncbi:pyridoxal-phosphate dependent enzyme [Candidatus Bathyarchaeota archaeon]|nr:MAG: pyridoxal-phosphate dependent enzyme [Candidatus Bathyarchaeota archaeon]
MFRKEFKEYGIGDTLFARLKNMEKLLDFSKFYVKFEAGNPTGTMKDRASYATLKYAKEKGFSTISVASCGNFGASIVKLSKIFEIVPHVYIPESYHSPRIAEMERMGGIIHRAPGTYEELVDLSGLEAGEQGWYNGNPGTEENSKVSFEAYETIAYEIFDELEYAPDAVSVSVSNGTCFRGVFKGFRKMFRQGKTDKIPVMIAASTTGGNPILSSFNDGRKKIENLSPDAITETPENEPIVSWKSLDGQQALDALWESDGYACAVSDAIMIAFSHLLEKEEGLSVLPASAASVAAMAEYVKARATPKDKCFVSVLTSRKY